MDKKNHIVKRILKLQNIELTDAIEISKIHITSAEKLNKQKTKSLSDMKRLTQISKSARKYLASSIMDEIQYTTANLVRNNISDIITNFNIKCNPF